jgi:ankyrin repeat protein
MFQAAMNGNTQRLQEILTETPDAINRYSPEGWTALALASHFGHKAAVELLLANGADLTLRSQNSQDNTALHAAIAGGRTEVAHLLIEHGADIDNVAGSGWTPLHLAAFEGNLEIVNTLLARGAQKNLKNNDGNTPLDLALKSNHQSVADRLRQQGAAE